MIRVKLGPKMSTFVKDGTSRRFQIEDRVMEARSAPGWNFFDDNCLDSTTKQLISGEHGDWDDTFTIKGTRLESLLSQYRADTTIAAKFQLSSDGWAIDSYEEQDGLDIAYPGLHLAVAQRFGEEDTVSTNGYLSPSWFGVSKTITEILNIYRDGREVAGIRASMVSVPEVDNIFSVSSSQEGGPSQSSNTTTLVRQGDSDSALAVTTFPEKESWGERFRRVARFDIETGDILDMVFLEVPTSGHEGWKVSSASDIIVDANPGPHRLLSHNFGEHALVTNISELITEKGSENDGEYMMGRQPKLALESMINTFNSICKGNKNVVNELLSSVRGNVSSCFRLGDPLFVQR